MPRVLLLLLLLLLLRVLLSLPALAPSCSDAMTCHYPAEYGGQGWESGVVSRRTSRQFFV
eukprot:SAG22_NODE_16049_length_334_cov_0.655319_2_plen_59_part_01